MPEEFHDLAMARLRQTEQNGLRIAIICRTIAITAALAWLISITYFSTLLDIRVLSIVVLFVFLLPGLLQLLAIGSRFDRWWLKYAIYTIDILGICSMFVLIPVSPEDDIPQIIAFRAYGIYYLFPAIAMACLALSWRFVLWSGFVAVVGWWSAFLWVIGGMERTLSWGDIPSQAMLEDYQNVFLSIDFIGVGNRVEETGFLLIATCVMALSVYRARRVFFAQIAAEAQHLREQKEKQHVREILGRYVPESIAEKLIGDPGALSPKIRHGSVLILDIAGFTGFAAGRSPNDVIAALDRFLANASEIVADFQGVVISFTGDGLLATFNAPLEVNRPEEASVRTALALLAKQKEMGFQFRIGIASGDIAAGNVGSAQRQSFTVYGATVNRSSRLESEGKNLGKNLLFDDRTANALGPQFNTSSLGFHQLRGLVGPLEILTINS